MVVIDGGHMIITKNFAGCQVLINPDFISTVVINGDEIRVEMSTGKTITLPMRAEYELKAKLLEVNHEMPKV
jgi:hypothetical protein